MSLLFHNVPQRIMSLVQADISDLLNWFRQNNISGSVSDDISHMS